MTWNSLFRRLFRSFQAEKPTKHLFKRFQPDFELLEIRWMPSVTAYQRVTDPEQGVGIPFQLGTILPNTGGIRVAHPLDFDLSPGTEVGRNPALVFNSESAQPRPIIQMEVTSNAGLGVPLRLEVDFTFDGNAQSTVTFQTTAHAAGDTYLLAVQADNAVTATGAYTWSAAVRTVYNSQTDTDNPSGTANAAVFGYTAGAYGHGWSIAGVDRIVSISGAAMYVYGSGGFRVFTGSSGTLTSPDNDFGTLVKNGGATWTYTAKDQTVYDFDTSGYMTKVTDTHSQVVTYTYSSGKLTKVETPDSGVTTLNYTGYTTQQGLLTLVYSIEEPGGRTQSLDRISGNSPNLTRLNDSEGGLRTFTYTSNKIEGDQWQPYRTTYTYDGSSGLFSSANAGQSTTSTLTPAAARGLAINPALNSSQAYGIIANGLSENTTFTLDSQGRVTKLATPDGAVHTYTLDSAGQVTVYQDPLNRVTSYAYSYGSGKGDLTLVTHPDASTSGYAYDSTFHHLNKYTDTLGQVTTYTIDGGTGDVTKIENAKNEVTTFTYSTGLLSTVKDALNRVTTMNYDGQRRLTQVTDALNGKTTTTYDANGNIETIKDQLGQVMTYTYDTLNRLKLVANPVGGLITINYLASGKPDDVDEFGNMTDFAYDTRGIPTAQTMASGSGFASTTTSTYDAATRLVTQKDGNSFTTTMTYDAVGRLRTIKTPVLGVTTFTYDLAGQQTAMTNPLDKTTTYTYTNRGWQETVKDAALNVVTTSYNTEGNPTAVIDARSNRTTMTYDALNRLETVKDALLGVTTVVYDAVGNQNAIVDARGNRTTSTYDALNRVTAVTDALNHTKSIEYDAVSNATRTLDALGFATTMTYDAINRRVTIQAPGSGTATIAYDAASNVTSSVDPLGNTTAYAYDVLNRVTSTTDALSGTTAMTYDSVGNVTTVEDSVSNTTTFAYDGASRLTQETDPFGRSVTYAYDLADRLTSRTDRLSRRRDFSYDDIDRVTLETWIDSGTVNLLTYTYDANSNLLTAQDYNSRYTMTYDALNRVTVTNEPFSVTLTVAYDAVNNRSLVQDSFGGIRTATYDAANRNTKVEHSGGTSLRLDLAYTDRNQVATITRYSDLAGSTKVGTSLYTYDSAMQLTNLRHRNTGDAVFANYTHTYDLAGRVETEKLNGGSTVTYTYDTTNQLTNDGTTGFTYDANGNRTGGGYATGTANQITNDGTWTYTYDYEGSLTKKSKGASLDTWTFGYDNLNRMTWAKERSTDGGGNLLVLATYTYDLFGDRIQSDVFTSQAGVVATTRFAFLDHDAFIDMNSSNVLQMRRLYLDGVDQLYARINSVGTAAWYLPDRLGSVRGMVDATGVAKDTITYEGFGRIAVETDATFGDRYKFTSRELDAETGLQYARSRYLQLDVGKWTVRDPIGFQGGDSNTYRYVGNASVQFTDPYGLQTPTSPVYPLPPNSKDNPMFVPPGWVNQLPPGTWYQTEWPNGAVRQVPPGGAPPQSPTKPKDRPFTNEDWRPARTPPAVTTSPSGGGPIQPMPPAGPPASQGTGVRPREPEPLPYGEFYIRRLQTWTQQVSPFSGPGYASGFYPRPHQPYSEPPNDGFRPLWTLPPKRDPGP